MLKKILIIATLGTGLAVAAIPAEARSRHHDDRAAGAIVGATLGALIGSSVNGGDGAIVGGVLGAVTGASVAGSHYYGGGYYTGYAPRYYSAPRYYAPRHYGGYRPARAYRDRDRDGVPNRYDRAPYNPRWR